eukprot:gene37130-45071_t
MLKSLQACFTNARATHSKKVTAESGQIKLINLANSSCVYLIMEGYVVIKGTFSSPTVWMVLDGQDVTYYERLDKDSETPRNIKGFINVRDAKISKLDQEVTNNGIKIKTSKGKLTFCCKD